MKRVRIGYWHGNDATILSGNRKEGYAILIGSGYTEEEIKFAKWVSEGNLPNEEEMEDAEFMEKYDNYKEMIVYADTEEWRYQNS